LTRKNVAASPGIAAHRLRRFALLFLTLFLFGQTVPHAAAQDGSQPVFGVVEAGAHPAAAEQLGADWERLTFHWNKFQPGGPDDFNPEAISNAALESARAAGRQVVGLIKDTPAWASASGSPAAVPAGLDLPHDDPANHFASFVRRLVTHYSTQGIHHWIIWNEPDIRPGEGSVEFEGEVEDYFRLLKSGYLAARAADPNAHIQMAGLTWWYDSERGREPYLLRLLRVISADPDARRHNWYFDGISLHIYFTTSTVWSLTGAYRHILSQFGLQSKAIWLTEYNASPRRDPAAAIGAPFSLSLEQQADFIVQASALALAAGVDRMAVYKLYDDNFVPGQTEPWGLVRADGSLRPAFHAYQQVMAIFAGARNVRRYSNNTATLITGGTRLVLWNDTFEAGEFMIAVSGTPEVQVADAYGSQWTVEVANGTAILDAPPAERVDVDWVVVAGPVRLVTIPGNLRSVAFRSASGVTAHLYP